MILLSNPPHLESVELYCNYCNLMNYLRVLLLSTVQGYDCSDVDTAAECA